MFARLFPRILSVSCSSVSTWASSSIFVLDPIACFAFARSCTAWTILSIWLICSGVAWTDFRARVALVVEGSLNLFGLILRFSSTFIRRVRQCGILICMP